MDDNKKSLVIAVVGVVVIVVVILAVLSVTQSGTSGEPAAPSAGSKLPAGASTRSAAPSNVAVPGANASSVPQNVAVPIVVAPANPGNTASFRNYEISIEGGKFVPDTMIVNQGDTVHITFTAVDRDYDFTQPDYGLNFPIPKGTPKVLEFGASGQGDFLFYCAQCGGPDRGPRGHVIVAGKK